jgi:uncharacterized membrane protein (UPF0136 family)
MHDEFMANVAPSQWLSEEQRVISGHVRHPALLLVLDWGFRMHTPVSCFSISVVLVCREIDAIVTTSIKTRISRAPALLRQLPGVGVWYGIRADIGTGYRIKQNQDYGTELALGNSLLLMGSAVPRIMKTGGRAPVQIALGATGALATWYYQKKVREFRYGV